MSLYEASDGGDLSEEAPHSFKTSQERICNFEIP